MRWNSFRNLLEHGFSAANTRVDEEEFALLADNLKVKLVLENLLDSIDI